MMAIKKYSGLLIFGQLISLCVIAQVDSSAIHTDSAEVKALVIPLNRQLAHDNIDKEQQLALNYDTTNGNFFRDSTKKDKDSSLQALTTKIDSLQFKIERDTLLNHNKKLYYLKGLQNLLKNLRTGWRSKQFDPTLLPAVVTAYDQCMDLDKNNTGIDSLINTLYYYVATPVVRSSAFDTNTGIKSSQDLLILKYCLLYPAETLITLKNNPDVPFADSLVKIVARKYPAQLYSFAQGGNKLGAIIRNIKDDDFVKAIAIMSQSRSGQQYFPFLDNIIKGKITIAQIDSLKEDSLQYYRLLVNTQLDYTQRAINGDTAYEFRSLTERLTVKAKDIFVNTINGLHNEPDAIRFQCIQSLTAQELYYLAVLTHGLIYTSSYTKGVYPLMMKKMGNRGDSLLQSVYFDHYRKFISQAAAYNTLSGFLSSFPRHDDAAKLMQSFVNNLEKTNGLEDGVDVADSYASIYETNKKLSEEILNLVKENYQRNLSASSKRGITIYNILNQLFLSADSSQKIDLTKELGIPPVYTVPFSSLVNEKDTVIIQVFFYGDKETIEIDFPEFEKIFSNENWSIDKSNAQWISIRTTKGKPVVIYANKPLPEETGEDDMAQQALNQFLEKGNLHPTITIHRGHSYFANSTIGYMSPISRIVFMGSCGGFPLIDAILKKSPDAHIIASKQIGMRAVNKPFIQLLTDKLRTGNNIDWIPFWKEFKNNARVEGFEDYIPPYKNLGAIFIKAYKKAMSE
ncbi:MAG: hypothetical protein ABI675_29175 [Chitinophagaceae bacterium]